MKHLSQHGNWDSQLDARVRDALATRFSEYDEDTFDFAVCQRPNGSYYGIADGKRCIKGRGPLNRANILRDLAVRRRIPRDTLKKLATVKDDKEFSKAASALAAVGRGKAGGPAITPVSKPSSSLQKQQTPKGGVDTAAKRKEATMGDGRADKKAKIAERRALLRQKLAERTKEAKKVQEQPQPKQQTKPASGPPKTRAEGIEELRKLGFVRNDKLLPRLEALDDAKFNRLVELARARAAEREALSGLTPDQKNAVRKVSGAKRTVLKEGGSAEESRRLTAALTELYNNSKTGKAEKGQTLYPPEVAKQYVSFLENGQLAVSKRVVSDEELKGIWDSVPAKVRADLKKKGSPPDYIAKDDARGKNILKLLVETGFRDEATGQPYSWRDIQPDHKTPIALYKGPKADLEKGNLMMVHKGFNNMKGTLEGRATSRSDGEAFVKAELLKNFRQQASRSREEFDRLIGEASSRASAAGELKSVLRANAPLWSKSDWVQNVGSMDAGGLKILASLENKADRSKPNRFKPSYSQGRAFVPQYASQNVLAAALLLNKDVPREQWPPGLWDKSLRAFEKDLKDTQRKARMEGNSGYDRQFFDRFSSFVGGNVPPEFRQIAEANFE